MWKIENKALVLRLGQPSTLISHKNGGFRKRYSNRMNLKPPVFSVFVWMENILKMELWTTWLHDNHVIFCSSIFKTQIQNDRWLLRFSSSLGFFFLRKTFEAFSECRKRLRFQNSPSVVGTGLKPAISELFLIFTEINPPITAQGNHTLRRPSSSENRTVIGRRLTLRTISQSLLISKERAFSPQFCSSIIYPTRKTVWPHFQTTRRESKLRRVAECFSRS